MPDGDPWYLLLLTRLGVNTTKLRWWIYQREQQAQRLAQEGRNPGFLQWMRYPNKICPHCHGLNNREARVCDSCGKRLPSMLGYRVRRLVGSIIPEQGPVVTYTFLGLMMIVLSVQLAMDGLGMHAIMRPSSAALWTLGAFVPGPGMGSEAWRWMAAGLVHGGLMHIGFNTYALMQVGPLLESQMSRLRMFCLVTFSQMASSLVCYVWYYHVLKSNVSVVGASGWIFGLIGFGIVYAHRAGPSMRPLRDALIRWAGFILIFGFVLGFMGGGISNAAHIGGLIGGLLFSLLPEGDARNEKQATVFWNSAAFASVTVWLVTIGFIVHSIVVEWPKVSPQ